MVVSFLPIYFQYKGFSSSQIGWFLAIGPFVGLIAQPLWGYASDKYKTVKKVLFSCLIGFSVSVIWLFQIDSFLWIIIAGSLFFFFSHQLILWLIIWQKDNLRFTPLHLAQ
ncbi:MFS transporter [Metabacillus endolithicus]|uniref:MFS transporter n=1 Tax=Metabacillus endolithicus TaxID=1535204 RepID=UPI003CD0D8C0